ATRRARGSYAIHLLRFRGILGRRALARTAAPDPGGPLAMLRKLIPLLVLGLVLAPVAHAQTVDEILAKHFEAEGGLDKLKSLQSRRVTGTMMMGPGMEAPIVLEQKRPGKRRIEFVVQGMTGVQAFDGERAWSLLPFMGKTDPEYASEKDSKKNGTIQYYYLDTETYLLVKQEGKTKRRGTEFDGESFFSDYKEVDGFMVPFVMEQGAKGMEQRQKMSFSKIEMNVPLDDSSFVMPGAAAVTDTSKTAKAAAV